MEKVSIQNGSPGVLFYTGVLPNRCSKKAKGGGSGRLQGVSGSPFCQLFAGTVGLVVQLYPGACGTSRECSAVLEKYNDVVTLIE